MTMAPWSVALPVVAAGAGISAWSAFHPAAQLFGRTIRKTGRRSALALTFDDGPNPAATPRLLDLLDAHQAQASFFMIGRYVNRYPKLAAEITARGHAVGNHTDTHPSLLWLSSRRIADELQRCQERIEMAAGRRARWMRPPYGFRGPQLDGVVRRGGFEGVVMWSVTGKDWDPQPASLLKDRLRGARGGDIILLHDGDSRALEADRSHVIGALEFWLPRWRDAGLELVSLDALERR